MDNKILLFIKWIAIVQLILIFFLLLLTFLTKRYFDYKTRQKSLLAKRIEKKWRQQIKENKEIFPENLKFKKQHFLLLLEIIKKLDQDFNITTWKEKRDQIMKLVILPKAIKLSRSKNWFDRFMACQAFELDIHQASIYEDIIKKLLLDEVTIVAIAAVHVALSYNSQALIDVMIDRFAKVRRIQQSFYADLLASPPKNKAPFFANKLMRTDDPYTKAFCYRVLSLLPKPFEIIPSMQQDLQSENKDLKLSALTYFAHSQFENAEAILSAALLDAAWEVRAKAAYLLGNLKLESTASALEKTLKDPEWWVRINSAEALVKIGPAGIKILEAQTPKLDRYAYETAQFLLLKTRTDSRN